MVEYARYCQRYAKHKRPYVYLWHDGDGGEWGHFCPPCREFMLSKEKIENEKSDS